MTRLIAISMLLLGPWTACLCPIKSDAVEGKTKADCDTEFYNDLSGSLFRVSRIQGKTKKEHWMTFRVTKNCDVLYPEDLSPLGIRSFNIKGPRSSTGPTLLMRINESDMAGKPIICSAPLFADKPMHLICPIMGGQISYLLEPME
jgi:hypothetical protein